MEWVLFAAVLAVVALGLLLREPFAEFRKRRREREKARKKARRRQRELDKERRRIERAMNPVKAAARKGAPRWQQVAQRQGGKCWLCGTRTYADDRRRVDVGMEQFGATYPCVDYVVALDRGGTYAMDNLRIAHRGCQDRRRADGSRTTFAPPKRSFPA
jgi:5-methylcytosine-specific restriction endonuclease McrA